MPPFGEGVTRVEYLTRLTECVSLAAAGRRGALSEDRFLTANYRPEFYGTLESQLSNPSPLVRREAVELLTALGERAAMDAVRRMRVEDTEFVSLACLGYLSSMEQADTAVPDLIDILRHSRGSEFAVAARRLGSIARPEDIPAIRKEYGRVDGEMREQIASALSRIVTRHLSLEPKRRYIMSVPVFPDEAAFTAFADRAIDYLGVRYHESIEPRRRVTERTYNNVASSIRTMQVRLYNERENLRYYSREASDRFSYLEDLVVWAAEDLAGKEVVMDERKVGRLAGIDGL